MEKSTNRSLSSNTESSEVCIVAKFSSNTAADLKFGLLICVETPTLPGKPILGVYQPVVLEFLNKMANHCGNRVTIEDILNSHQEHNPY